MIDAHQETVVTDQMSTELEDRRWAVISFDRVEGENLTYADALRLLSELDAKGSVGLCIVTDQTAARLAV